MRKRPLRSPAKIQHRIYRHCQHRTPDQFAALGSEHRLGFRMFAKQPAIDQRRQILATLGGEFKAVLDQACCRHAGCVVMEISSRHPEKQISKKKSRARSPAQKLCRPYFPAKFGFDLDLRGDAACARQGSSRDLDHQTSTFRPA
jgi:hypothetical protein